MFVIVAEGTVTEREYFALFENTIVHINCLKSKENLPPKKALARIMEYIRKEGLRASDQAWVVVDKDSWLEAHLHELHNWAKTRPKQYGFALSNPKFEYWLLLHFENAKAVATGQDCDERLAKCIPGYDKHIDSRLFSRERIELAIETAEKRDNPPCVDWPRTAGTTVYRLVKTILA